ncbi:hypothetical protein L3N51_01576 [Metallosphaera sp. J1]|uniref:hypothetical protein n=1 Tax=Metallosphaera javensis (ex Hofmann et al. 2022) TaxID=99938 RepID=UPI001EDCA817|nr:hypothetical protein [Metallosphaera javensis (ex Hofmann et al. 2022)]MCG3109286.1 hypothetical protein [Metallosphaera javensis (ex Hofmann et al. 2022)]
MISLNSSDSHVTFSDIIDANLLRKRYQDYEKSLKRSKPRDLMLVVKDFLTFVKGLKTSVTSSWLASNLAEQERIAKRIFTVLRLRYFILFLYRKIVDGLVTRLLNLIKSLVTQISLT